MLDVFATWTNRRAYGLNCEHISMEEKWNNFGKTNKCQIYWEKGSICHFYGKNVGFRLNRLFHTAQKKRTLILTQKLFIQFRLTLHPQTVCAQTACINQKEWIISVINMKWKFIVLKKNKWASLKCHTGLRPAQQTKTTT